jgi:hypothetical protein
VTQWNSQEQNNNVCLKIDYRVVLFLAFCFRALSFALTVQVWRHAIEDRSGVGTTRSAAQAVTKPEP